MDEKLFERFVVAVEGISTALQRDVNMRRASAERSGQGRKGYWEDRYKNPFISCPAGCGGLLTHAGEPHECKLKGER